MTSRMENVAKALSSLPTATTDFDVWDEVYPGSGLYVRCANYKAGDMVIGHEHVNFDITIISKGSLILMGDIFGPQVRIVAPYVFETGPGSQKFFKCLEDVTMMNVMRASEGETADEVYERNMNKKEIK